MNNRTAGRPATRGPADDGIDDDARTIHPSALTQQAPEPPAATAPTPGRRVTLLADDADLIATAMLQGARVQEWEFDRKAGKVVARLVAVPEGLADQFLAGAVTVDVRAFCTMQRRVRDAIRARARAGRRGTR